MNDISDLKKELNDKIHNLFKDHQSYLDYLLQTKKNFLYRYIETSTDKNIQVQSLDAKTLIGISFESNMGEAFKINSLIAKEGIRQLAKSIPREEKPRVQYSLKTIIEELRGDSGKITIESKISWDFPNFDNDKNAIKKCIFFEYHDPNIFRKELALKYEEACAIF